MNSRSPEFTWSSARRTLRWIGGLTAIGLVAYAMADRREQLVRELERFDTRTLAVSLALLILGLIANMLSWRAVLIALGEPITVTAAGRVYLIAQLGKYLPGSVWPIMAQAELAGERGVNRVRAGSASILALLIGVAVGSIVAGVALVGSPHFIPHDWYALFAAILAIILVYPRSVRFLLRVTARTLRRSGVRLPTEVDTRAVVIAACWSALMWFFLGLHAFTLAGALSDSSGLLLFSIGAYAASWVVGFLSLMFPAGIGAREAMLAIVFSPVIGATQALTLAVVSRVISILGDGFGLGLGWGLDRIARRRTHLLLAREKNSEGPTTTRKPQYEYSKLQSLMLDEADRTQKARKISSVLEHFLGTNSFRGTTAVDVGCSGGVISETLARRGARVIGLDLDDSALRVAHRRVDRQATYVRADSEFLPLGSESVDVIVCNHVYEHVVDHGLLFAELRRVIKPTGVIYLGLGNRFGVLEPHYRLPFLSWLPPSLSHAYLRVTGKGDHYHERFLSRSQLLHHFNGLHVWEYTWTILRSPDQLHAEDAVPRFLSWLPVTLLKLMRPIVPTFIWLATPSVTAAPQGPRLRQPPESLSIRTAGRHRATPDQ